MRSGVRTSLAARRVTVPPEASWMPDLRLAVHLTKCKSAAGDHAGARTHQRFHRLVSRSAAPARNFGPAWRLQLRVRQQPPRRSPELLKIDDNLVYLRVQRLHGRRAGAIVAISQHLVIDRSLVLRRARIEIQLHTRKLGRQRTIRPIHDCSPVVPSEACKDEGPAIPLFQLVEPRP